MPKNEKSYSEKRILWIVPRVPWPPSCGASIANCALISALSEQGWRIDLLCLSKWNENSDTDEIRTKLRLSSVEILSFSFWMRRRFSRVVLSLLYQLVNKEIPLTAIPFASDRIGKFIVDRIITQKHRIVLWDGLHPMAASMRSEMWQRLHSKPPLIQVYRAHNCESDLWKQYILKANFLMRPVVTQQAKTMENFEKKCVSLTTKTLTISENDSQLLQNIGVGHQKMTTVPVSLPSIRLSHTPFSEFSEANHFVAKNGVLSLLWMGGMDWWPNREGLQWFLKYVWPLLNRCERQFQLSLIGKGTQQLGSLCTGNISAHGFVPDPVSYLHQADLLIVPIFSGAGIRIKALEALSHSVPCLGTPVGLSGIPLEGCWIGQSCEAWLDILHHLTPEMCKNKGRDGQLTVQQKHCTQTIGKNLDELLSKLVMEQKSLNND